MKTFLPDFLEMLNDLTFAVATGLMVLGIIAMLYVAWRLAR